MTLIASALPQLSSIGVTPPAIVLLAACVGLTGGVTSGLCGVSPGGALVVLSTLLLGVEQHVAQGISLAAQIPPTSLTAIRRYQAEGNDCPKGSLPWLTTGVLVGGLSGALGAAHASSAILQWSYVSYLALLDALLILRSQVPARLAAARADGIARLPLLTVGLLAGVSSGYLGIGGGLAIVVGLTAGLKVPQHQAQAISLVLSIVPTTAPAAYVYWREGLLPHWQILAAVIAGLWCGTHLGARAANRLGPATLRRMLISLTTAMTAYMACRALIGASAV